MLKKIVLIGPLTKHIPTINADYAGIDAGSMICLEHKVNMLFAIGDFDSISDEDYQTLSKNTQCIKLDEHKNETDSEAAVIHAYNLGYEEIILYGVTGGRADHEIANLRLLSERDYPLTIMNETNYLKVLHLGIYKLKKKYDYLSFFAIHNSCISISNVEYPLDKKNILRKDIYCCSNEIIDEAIVNVHSGKVLMILCNDSIKYK